MSIKSKLSVERCSTAKTKENPTGQKLSNGLTMEAKTNFGELLQLDQARL